MVQWSGLCTFTAKGPGSIPGQGTKVPQATGRGQKKKKKFTAIYSIYCKALLPEQRCSLAFTWWCSSKVFQTIEPKLYLKTFSRTGISSWPSRGLLIPSFEHNRPVKFPSDKLGRYLQLRNMCILQEATESTVLPLKTTNLYMPVGETFC